MSEDHPPLPLVVTLAALTVVSGFVDAVSFLGLGHVFTANMTGNVVLIGFAAPAHPGSRWRPASARSAPSSPAPSSGAGWRNGSVRPGTCCWSPW